MNPITPPTSAHQIIRYLAHLHAVDIKTSQEALRAAHRAHHTQERSAYFEGATYWWDRAMVLRTIIRAIYDGTAANWPPDRANRP